MTNSSRAFPAVVFGLLLCSPAMAQTTPPAGIPVTHAETRASCGGCHQPDSSGRMTRISYVRMSPEGWQETIKRMMRNHAVQLTPVQARSIVKYLSNNHGLAPDETRPAFYEIEKRMVREQVPDELQACIKCHSVGRVLLQRRNRDEWQLLLNMHLGFFPLTEFQAFSIVPDPSARQARIVPYVEEPSRILDAERPGPVAGSGTAPARPGDEVRDPMERAVEFLGKTYPFETPEFGTWRANFRQPRLEGTWSIETYLAGKGRGYGQIVIERDTADDEFRTRTTIEFADGDRMSRTGRVILYAGYNWRGTSTDAETKVANLKDVREVMMLSPDFETLRGRWYAGAYEEFGLEILARRVRRDPVITGTDLTRLMTGRNATVRIFGSNLPQDVRKEEIDFGAGVAVNSVRAAGSHIVVDVSVAANAVVGSRDLLVRGTPAKRVVAVIDRIDYVRVLPEQALSRLGGAGQFPKGYAQFDAVGFHNGPDGRSGTADDVELGRLDAAWSLEEFTATVGDDDIKYVGNLDSKGLFTPNIEGPNPERRQSTNNMGDVRVTATYSGEGAAKPLKGTAHLVVTVPIYMKWLQLEIHP